MKRQSPLRGGISVLIGVVIAILALVRGDWLIPLLLAAFGIWGIWLARARLLPVWRNNRLYRQCLERLDRQDTSSGAQASAVLLRHVNYRISALLKAAYPKARWEWTMEDPAAFAVTGGTGRLRLYGVPDYEYADVTLDQMANLRCELVKTAPVTPGSGQAGDLSLDPQAWFELRGRLVLDTLIPDLQSRGHSSLTVKENGEIVLLNEDGGEEPTRETLPDLPQRMYWPQLIQVLKQEGLSADTDERGLLISW